MSISLYIVNLQPFLIFRIVVVLVVLVVLFKFIKTTKELLSFKSCRRVVAFHLWMLFFHSSLPISMTVGVKVIKLSIG